MSAVTKLVICIAVFAPLMACELVADFDRGKIPVPDAGAQLDASLRDAATHDAAVGEDAGDEDAAAH